MMPRGAGPGLSLAPGLFHPDDALRRTPPTMSTLEDLYHYHYNLYQYLPPRPLSDWGLLPPPGLPPALPPGLAALPSGLHYEPLSLISTPPPLDLSVKAVPATPITPPSTPSPASPSSRKRHFQDTLTPVKLDNNNDESATNHNVPPPTKRPPGSASHSAPKTPAKKTKAVRKLTFDEDKSSPVSGTIIRDIGEVDPDSVVVRKGDIDPAFNVVEVTEEAKAELASIENKIGDYVCRLCRELYDDAFSLAQHRCSCIVHVEYRCPECDKVFNCPANLASHRRWHKPKMPVAVPAKLEETLGGDPNDAKEADSNQPQIPCPVCHKRFRRQAYLRKHLSTHSHPLAGAGGAQVPAGFTISVPPPQTDLDLPVAN